MGAHLLLSRTLTCRYSALYVVIGLPLEPYVEDMKAFCEQLGLHNQDQCVALILPYHQLALNLMGRSDDPLVLTGEAMNQEAFLKIEDSDEDRDMGVAAVNFDFVLLMLAYIFQDKDMIESRWKDDHGKKGVISGSHFLNYFDILFNGMAAYFLYRSTKKKKYLVQAKRYQSRMKQLVKRCGLNTHAMYLLLLAERQSLKADVNTARKYYDNAISCFARTGFIHLEAIACERAGDYMDKFSDKFWSLSYYDRARLRYIEWGAIAKAHQLRELHGLNNYESRPDKSNVLISVRGRRRYDPSNWQVIDDSSGP